MQKLKMRSGTMDQNRGRRKSRSSGKRMQKVSSQLENKGRQRIILDEVKKQLPHAGNLKMLFHNIYMNFGVFLFVYY